MGCDGCKHWEAALQTQHWHADNMEDATGNKVGMCKRPMLWWDATDWVKRWEDAEGDEPSIRRVKPEFAEAKMFTQDGSDYEAYLLTSADFFCAQYEGRE